MTSLAAFSSTEMRKPLICKMNRKSLSGNLNICLPYRNNISTANHRVLLPTQTVQVFNNRKSVADLHPSVMRLILLIVVSFSCTRDFLGTEGLVDQYGLKGTSVHLRISHRNQLHQHTDFVWRRFNNQELLANSIGVSPHFMKKMKMNVTDGSLTIINLEVNDSGTYRALWNWESETLAEFRLIVENAVSEPTLTVSQSESNSSAAECRASVNCSADDSWAIFDCDQSLCAQTQASLSSININVTVLGNRLIQCHASNHVSHSHSQTLNIMCQEKQTDDLPSPPGLIFFVVIAVCFCVILGVLGLVVVLFKKLNSSKVHPQSGPSMTVNTVSDQSPETIYSTLHKPNTHQTAPQNNTDSNPEGTIYDCPSRHPKVHQADSVEVVVENQEQHRPQEHRTVKVKATVHQAAEPDCEQINTVYCKLGEI